jgi:hypothetical protein
MRKRMMSVALGFVVMLAGASIGHADNLLSDPGFELSTADGSFPDSGHWKPAWAPSTAGALCTTTAARNDPGKGLWAYTGDAAEAYWSGPYQEFPAQAGDVYSAQGWGRSVSAEPWQNESKALIRIQFLNASHSVMQQYDSNAVTSADSGWQSLSLDTPPAPSGVAYVRFVFYLQKPEVAGISVANFDDATLSVVRVPLLSVSPGALGFGETTAELTLAIKNPGSGALNWSIAKDAGWLGVEPASGTTTTGSDTVRISVDRAGLLQENYRATLQVTSNGGAKSIPVYLETPRTYPVPSQPASVFLVGRTLYVQRRMPDGSLDVARPFIVKGVAWSPASVGTLDDPSSRQAEFFKSYTLDIPMLKEMNANTVYTFIDFGTDAPAFSVLDELYKSGIYAIVTVDWDGTNNTDRIRAIVNAYKNHPAVLMWAIGNEWNINLYHGKYSTVDQAAAATQSAAQLIKSLDAGHPVAGIYGEIEILPNQPLSKTADIVSTICPAVDVWGLNIYRGDNFSSLFTQWASITDKPMFLSEFGADSFISIPPWYPAVAGYEDETAQKNYVTAQWRDITPELSALDPIKVCMGGTVFEWVDEWWKVLAKDGGSFTLQDNGGFETSWNPTAQPDGFANEEYFGIVKIDRTPKETFAALRQAFQSTTIDQQYTLTVNITGSGSGTVAGTLPGFSCNTGECSATLDKYAIVTFLPAPAPGSVFTGWSGACTGTGDCTVAMDAAKTVTAIFTLTTFTIATTAGSGGSISPVSPAVDYGASRTFTITPSAHYHIVDVLVDGASAGAVTTVDFSNVTAAHTISAAFEIDTHTLAVTKSGTGSGSVTASPGTLSWSGTTGSASYQYATQVTLTVVPDMKSTFTGWSGACAGTEGCTITMDGDKTLAASFNLKGDINDDGFVSLADAIMALQTIGEMKPAGIRLDYAASGADVGGDNRIGLEEIIYILQRVAGMRP